MELQRCAWCDYDELYRYYHDYRWGKPLFDNHDLFRMLCLEGMQAGLSWYQILQREAAYSEVFEQWDIHKIAQYDEQKRAQLLQNPGIIRNRLKINAIIENAKAYERMQAEGINFTDFLWAFVNHQPQINHFATLAEVPTQTVISQQMSKSLKQKGFRFVGPTICYAFMQATGMVCDHLTTCPQHPDNHPKSY